MSPKPFEERFDDLYSVAYRVAYRVLGSRPDAEDVAQEALVRTCMAWRKAARSANGWVAKIAGDLAIDVWRRRQRRPATETAVPSDPFDAVDQRVGLQVALDSLSRRQREVVVLRYLADLPEAEVAAALGCSAGTVKQHASRGLASLRNSLTTVSTEGR